MVSYKCIKARINEVHVISNYKNAIFVYKSFQKLELRPIKSLLLKSFESLLFLRNDELLLFTDAPVALGEYIFRNDELCLILL